MIRRQIISSSQTSVWSTETLDLRARCRFVASLDELRFSHLRQLSRYYGLWMWFPELFKRVEEGGSACANVSVPARTENISCYPVKTVGVYPRWCHIHRLSLSHLKTAS